MTWTPPSMRNESVLVQNGVAIVGGKPWYGLGRYSKKKRRIVTEVAVRNKRDVLKVMNALARRTR